MDNLFSPDCVAAVRTVTHRKSWRGEPYRLSYVLLRDEPDAVSLLAGYRWALGEGLPNPRIISPRLLAWSALFQPTLHTACQRHGGLPARRLMRFDGLAPNGCADSAGLQRLWLQSVVFLASVTLSAAIIQGRWSRGTLESKFDRLWQAATSAALPAGTNGRVLRDDIMRLSSSAEPPIEILLSLRRHFMALIDALSADTAAERVTVVALKPVTEERFGFAAWLADWLPGLTGVVVYGSSLTSNDYADIDAILVVDDAEYVLRLLENRKLLWGGKELNVGVYTQAEFWRMQLLSGDNLASYGRCVLGEVELPHKPVPVLLARNLSFGIVRQRQQLGMLARALGEPASGPDDRRNLHEYFVKIPANVAKGTFGANGRHHSKPEIQAWLKDRTGFDTEREQRAVLTEGPARPLAASAVATLNALEQLNAELGIIAPQLEEAA
ncbi:hypothetical protein [Sphingomonas sp. CFBP 8760]|uniref:hypothetical protein n=1 Tax=Sphingomonas sp. CFBP 8760 TaxID=2775282 RepID=UPI0017819853|nr:hypothetical protein [Sphingomonas sp. CFBP 8760]MBD8546790.1 hypothetical protein [Sphingomonas sp. CFBP 8760]